jgi:hypothetical protein
MQRIDCEPAQRAWERGFDIYREHRRQYFYEAPGPLGRTKKGDPRYSQHFSRLGNFIGKASGTTPTGWDPGPTARRLFRRHAAIFDLLPYWSSDTRHLDRSRVRLDRHASIAAWQAVLNAFIEEKQPVAIIVNNCGDRALIQTMLSCSLAPVPQTEFYGGVSETADLRIPVLAHPFLSSWRRSQQEYTRQFQEWVRNMALRQPLLSDQFLEQVGCVQ